MFKTIKTVTLVIVISFAFITVSCLSTFDEEVERTPEQEAAELSEVLSDIEGNGYDIDTTALGVFYVVHVEGSDTLPQAGDTCYLQYDGFLLDGTLFDASAHHYADGIWEFVFQEIQLIPGFDDGIALMGKGTELDMFIPSHLAYGAYGSSTIAPFSTLMFSAKMVDIKPYVD